MPTSHHASPIQLRQTKQRFSSLDSYLSYELGNSVQSLPPRYTRLLATGLSVIFLSTIAWATFSKVDEVAETQGQLVPASQVQPMRALSSGRLKEIAVIEHQHVKKNDVLIQLDPTLSETEVQRLKQQVQLKQQDLARLDAERIGKTDAGDLLQNQLLAARLKEFRDRRAAAEAEAKRQLSMVKAAQLELSRLQTDLNFVLTKSRSLQTLVTQGAFPRLDYLETRNQVASLQKEVAKQVQAITQAQQATQSAQGSANRIESERQSEILTQINTLQQDLANLQGQLAQAQNQRDLGTIKAPVTGVVYNVRINTTGGIVQAGDELLSIVPDGESLRLEVKVSNHDIGFVKPEMKAKVKLATFPYQEFGTLSGSVEETISPNAISDKDGNLLYTARIQLTGLQQNSVKLRGQPITLVPGMTATAEIVIRQKSVMTFLLDPIIANWDKAFSVR